MEAVQDTPVEFLKHRSALYAFLLSIVRDFDLAQEAVWRAAEAARQAPPGGDFGAWIRKTALERLPKRARREVTLGAEAIEALERAAVPEGSLEAPLARRSGLDRWILARRYREAMAADAIARLQKTPVTSIRKTLARVRAELAGRAPAPPRFDELASLYLDAAVDREGQEELSRLVAAEPPLAARFRALARVHGALREIHVPLSDPPRGLWRKLLNFFQR